MAAVQSSTPDAIERKIIAMVASGYTNKRIADTLALSRRTIDGILHRLYQRLGPEIDGPDLEQQGNWETRQRLVDWWWKHGCKL